MAKIIEGIQLIEFPLLGNKQATINWQKFKGIQEVEFRFENKMGHEKLPHFKEFNWYNSCFNGK